MNEPGKTLLIAGVVLAIVGVGLMVTGRTGMPFGRLPGDITFRGRHSVFYFPLGTSILISIVVSVILYFIAHFRR